MDVMQENKIFVKIPTGVATSVCNRMKQEDVEENLKMKEESQDGADCKNFVHGGLDRRPDDHQNSYFGCAQDSRGVSDRDASSCEEHGQKGVGKDVIQEEEKVPNALIELSPAYSDKGKTTVMGYIETAKGLLESGSDSEAAKQLVAAKEPKIPLVASTTASSSQEDCAAPGLAAARAPPSKAGQQTKKKKKKLPKKAGPGTQGPSAPLPAVAVQAAGMTADLLSKNCHGEGIGPADWLAKNDAMLLDVYRLLQPHKKDVAKRLDLIGRLTHLVQQLEVCRGAHMVPFGSFASDFFTPWSDLDISLELMSEEGCGVNNKRKGWVLKEMYRIILRCGGARQVMVLPNARVPLLMFVDLRSGISCDISINSGNALLKSCTMRFISRIDDRCRQLIFLVKCWAKAHKINNPKSGSMNSYALSNLVIFHLQTREPPILPPLQAILDCADPPPSSDVPTARREVLLRRYEDRCQMFVQQGFGQRNGSSLGMLLHTFFHQMASMESLWAQGLAVCSHSATWRDLNTTPAWIDKKYCMAVVDPFQLGENCARSVQMSSFPTILRAFHEASQHLCSPARDPALLRDELFCWPAGQLQPGEIRSLPQARHPRHQSRPPLQAQRITRRTSANQPDAASSGKAPPGMQAAPGPLPNETTPQMPPLDLPSAPPPGWHPPCNPPGYPSNQFTLPRFLPAVAPPSLLPSLLHRHAGSRLHPTPPRFDLWHNPGGLDVSQVSICHQPDVAQGNDLEPHGMLPNSEMHASAVHGAASMAGAKASLSQARTAVPAGRAPQKPPGLVDAHFLSLLKKLQGAVPSAGPPPPAEGSSKLPERAIHPMPDRAAAPSANQHPDASQGVPAGKSRARKTRAAQSPLGCNQVDPKIEQLPRVDSTPGVAARVGATLPADYGSKQQRDGRPRRPRSKAPKAPHPGGAGVHSAARPMTDGSALPGGAASGAPKNVGKSLPSPGKVKGRGKVIQQGDASQVLTSGT